MYKNLNCRYIIILFLLFFIKNVNAQAFLSQEELSSLKNNYIFEGNYIGGLKNNKPHFKKYNFTNDYIVTKAEQFFKLIESKKLAGKIIYLKGDFDIDLSDRKNINLPSRLTIYGDRGKNGKKGARLFTRSSGSNPLFNINNNVKIFGLRIEGPDQDIFHNGVEYKGKNALNLNRYKDPVSTGIKIKGSNIIIENCEFSGWTYSAILVDNGSSNNKVRFSYFHHNRRYGLGYGITVNGGDVEVYGNIFNYNRHDIAGTGIKGSSYEVYMNVFLMNTTAHSIDMHGGKDRHDNTDIAGNYLKIYNNYFERENKKTRAFLLRGRPLEKSIFKNNYIKIKRKDTELISKTFQYEQINSKGNIVVEDNFIESF